MPNPSGPMLQCDFCRSRQLRWRYPARTFELPQWRDEQGRAWGSYGDWAACEQCADEIEADRWDLVTARSILQMQEKLQSTDPEIAARIASIHAGFREHRTGPRRAIRPPTPPITMAGVYSRALDEQDRIVRMLERPAVRDVLVNAATRAVGPEDAVGLFNITYASVAQSEAGYVSQLVCQLLEQAAPSVPDTVLEPHDLLVPHGFLLLQRPSTMLAEAAPPNAVYGPIRAMSWYSYGGASREGVEHPRGGIYLVAWAEFQAPSTFQVGPLNTTTWGFGERLSEAVVRRQHGSEREHATITGQWLTALNAFCRQQLVTGRRGQPERATRRRIEREQHRPAPDVLVVELRRTQQRIDHEPTGRKIGEDFSFSVSGHWRNHWYETIQDHRPLFIAPYVKGNLSAPLRPRRRVFAIVH